MKKSTVLFIALCAVFIAIGWISDYANIFVLFQKHHEKHRHQHFYKFEKTIIDMYDDVRQITLWLAFMDLERIKILTNENFC